MKIYVSDNGGQWTHKEWRVLKYLKVDTKIIPNTTPIEDLSDIDGLVLSGGALSTTDSINFGKTAEYLNNLDCPILGICAGLQFIAHHYKGEIGPAKFPEFGKTEIYLDKENEIFKNLPKKFLAWESHNDEIKKLPEEFIVLAHSENTRVQAIKHKSKAIYGVQFHPEVEHTEHGLDIFKNFLKIVEESRR
jgi:GMP synthase (glutamine-hydrolysing)